MPAGQLHLRAAPVTSQGLLQGQITRLVTVQHGGSYTWVLEM